MILEVFSKINDSMILKYIFLLDWNSVYLYQENILLISLEIPILPEQSDSSRTLKQLLLFLDSDISV